MVLAYVITLQVGFKFRMIAGSPINSVSVNREFHCESNGGFLDYNI